jgi:D-alanyl-D-alanine carboxypeptidase
MKKTLVVLTSVLLIASGLHGGEARAEARLLIDADTGKVLEGENATYPWYPASVTKLMTTYVTFKAVREQRITLDSVFTYGPNAAAQEPSKMGFKVGTQVTVDNALKMMLVHSANDMAVVLAEGVSGSIEKFSSEMNANAQRLGMTQTSYVNPNGLPADEQITSARDLAILARALIREFPEYDGYWHIGAIRFGKRIMSNTNRLLDAYPGADGMKTGFICASGFNIVATATRGDKRLIAVVLGAPSSAARTGRAAQMFERGFASNPLSWLTPSLGNVNALVPIATDPPNLREEICGKHHHRPGVDDDDASATASTDDHSFLLSSLHSSTPKASALLTSGLASPPIDVHVGPPHKPGSPSAAMATIEPAKRKPVAAAVAGKPAPATASAKPSAKPTVHAAVAPSQPTGPAGTAASPVKPWPSDTAVTKPAAAKPAATEKPKPTAALQPKPAGAAAKPKPAGTSELKPTVAADAPKPAKPKPTVAAVKPKPVAPPAPSAPRTEAQ